MESTGRMFLCAACRAQVVLCRRCDRGQVYCSNACSSQARRESVRAAGRRYQDSRRGRLAHAARARRYRARSNIVTHQGSITQAPGDLLTRQAAVMPAQEVNQDEVTPQTHKTVCTRCGALCALAVRLGFLRHRSVRNPRLTVPHRSRSPNEHWP